MVSSRLPSDLSLNIDLFYFSSFCFLYSTLLSTDTAISISHRLAQFLVSLPHIWSVSLDQRVWLYVHIPQFLGFQHFFVQWSYHFLVVFILTSQTYFNQCCLIRFQHTIQPLNHVFFSYSVFFNCCEMLFLSSLHTVCTSLPWFLNTFPALLCWQDLTLSGCQHPFCHLFL